MSKKKEPIEHKKWERRYEDDETISIWRYDTSKSTRGPYEVEFKPKKKQS
jgi:hypothetical protein